MVQSQQNLMDLNACRAGELGIPVGHMPFKGLLLHILDIWALARDFPDTKVIIDHFGFCKADHPDSEEWRELLALAELPQVYVKVSHCTGGLDLPD
jgi:predicted TIM-barrel fold metal-dependent hydrolase